MLLAFVLLAATAPDHIQIPPTGCIATGAIVTVHYLSVDHGARGLPPRKQSSWAESDSAVQSLVTPIAGIFL